MNNAEIIPFDEMIPMPFIIKVDVALEKFKESARRRAY